MQLTLEPASTDGLLGLWATRTVTADVEFSATDAPDTPDEEVVWQVNLPGDAAAASRALAGAQEGLESTRGQLVAVSDRLEEWLASDAEGSHRLDAEVTFDTVAEDPDRLVGAAVDGLRRLVRASAPTAWVETNCGEQLVARSRTSLLGGVSTVVLADDLRWVSQHQQTLRLASDTRITALQTTAVTVRAAVGIATRLGLPGGPLLALPLAWRFVRQFVEPPARGSGP